jgi:hypothetical protein
MRLGVQHHPKVAENGYVEQDNLPVALDGGRYIEKGTNRMQPREKIAQEAKACKRSDVMLRIC